MSTLLEQVAAAPRGTAGALDVKLAALPPRARARAYMRWTLHESGLRYGTPIGGVPEGSVGGAPEERLFLAVLHTLASLGLTLAELVGAPEGNRVEQLRVLFAVLTGELALAQSLDQALHKKQTPSRRRLAKVESALAERAMSLSGDPVYGLILHNGALYVDAAVFGHQAREYFSRGRLNVANARRRLEVAGREKALLVEVLTALACAERSPGYAAQRAILRQIEDLKLSERRTSELKARVKLAFERKPRLKDIVRGVRSHELQRFVLEQTVLASLVDGKRSPSEVAFVSDLARVLGVSEVEVKQLEVRVAEFYAKNRSILDVFTVSAGAGLMGEELVAKMERTLEKNFHRLLKEVRQTGELPFLLAKAARGQRLSPDEKRRMRTQLLDVAKAIPALAIFSAPGGILILIALAKVLPFNILPSAFQDPPLEAAPPPDPVLVPRPRKTAG